MSLSKIMELVIETLCFIKLWRPDLCTRNLLFKMHKNFVNFIKNFYYSSFKRPVIPKTIN